MSPIENSEVTVAVSGTPPTTVDVYINGQPVGSFSCLTENPCINEVEVPDGTAGQEFKVIATDSTEQTSTATKRIVSG
jgi:hypothetical protein